ncbi:YceI family protein [Mangrovicoccus algicola]|uniref:YceI family protein n=1 Tax=Mangrovicoccus algicola TaxID=2771008 RepID=A0A8J6YV50_9RHOB|nr:YceI family protein [Mangrovicoccus algicola]MBE3636638.1 YceI family protein [Mangrovicoccus algicola]
MIRRAFLVLTCLLPLLAGAARAEPRDYALDRSGSEVRFTYMVGGVPTEGIMQIKAARMRIDLSRVERSSAEVVLDAASIRAASQMATGALRGEKVLHVARHPEIRFVSRRVSGSLQEGGRIEGEVTIRGITRPLVLQARIYRSAESAPGDLSRLTVLLTGAIARSAFGADGYGDLVSDRVVLHIRARLAASDG